MQQINTTRVASNFFAEGQALTTTLKQSRKDMGNSHVSVDVYALTDVSDLAGHNGCLRNLIVEIYASGISLEGHNEELRDRLLLPWPAGKLGQSLFSSVMTGVYSVDVLTWLYVISELHAVSAVERIEAMHRTDMALK